MEQPLQNAPQLRGEQQSETRRPILLLRLLLRREPVQRWGRSHPLPSTAAAHQRPLQNQMMLLLLR